MKTTGLYISASQTVLSLPHVLRFSSWWHYKVPLLIGVFFLGQLLQGDNNSGRVLVQLSLLLMWMIAAASFGYFVNDWTDVEEDRLAGKKNTAATVLPWLRWVIIIACFFTALGLQYILNGFLLPLFLTVLQLLLFIAYSVRPVRLKQYLLPAVICDALYAHALPAAIVFTTICPVKQHRFVFALLCSWQLIAGIRNILLHHIIDRKNDLLSGNKNIANRFGPLRVLKFSNKILFPFDLIAGMVLLSSVNIYLFYIGLFLLLFRWFLVARVWENKRLWRNKKTSYWLANDVYELYVPIIAIAIFAISGPKLFMLLCVCYVIVFPQFVKSVTNDIKHYFAFFKGLFLYE